MLAFLLLACGPGDTDWTPVDTAVPDEDSVFCSAAIDAVDPIPGADTHLYTDPVTFWLSEPVSWFEVLADVPGEVSIDASGTVATWAPAAPLEPLTDYTLDIDYCGGQPSMSFSTSEYGLPLQATGLIDGQTYAVNMSGIEFGVGEHLGEALGDLVDRQMLFQFRDVTAESLSLRVGLGSPTSQDGCATTYDLEGVRLSELPSFSFDVDELMVPAWDTWWRLQQLTVRGTVAPDGLSIGGLRFGFTFDARELATFAELGDAETLCYFASQLGAPCGACPDDGEDWCVRLEGQIDEVKTAPVELEPIETVPDTCD